MRKQIIIPKNDERLNKTIDLIRQWAREKRVGKITVNMFKGGISSVNLEQTLKME